MNNKKVYIAGPMRGKFLYNYEAFLEAERELFKFGFNPINPHKLDEQNGVNVLDMPADSDWNILPKNFDLNKTIMTDVETILGCDYIFMLKGWEQSVGATAEKAIADWANISVLYQDNSKGFVFTSSID